MSEIRNNAWLEKKLQELLSAYFTDVTISNPIIIRFGREAKYRFGSIRLYKDGKGNWESMGSRGRAAGKFLRRILEKKPKQPAKSIITITSLFTSSTVPEDVVLYTLAHELCHYAHGFSSTNKRMFKYPHHGGVVNKELVKRGAGHFIKAYRIWIREYRREILASRS